MVIEAAGGPWQEIVSGTDPDWQPVDEPLQVPPTPTSEPGAATATPQPLSPVAAPDTGDGSSAPGASASIWLAALVAVGIAAAAIGALVLRRRA